MLNSNQFLMLKFILPFICFILALNVHAQNQSDLSIKIDFGLVVPLGEFANTETETDGFAKIGYALDIGFEKIILNKLSAHFLYSQNEIPTEIDLYNESILNQLPDTLLNGGYGSNTNWQISKLMLGPAFTFLDKNLSVQVHVLTGLVLQNSLLLSTGRGNYDYTIDYANGTFYTESVNYGKPKTSFGYILGANARYPISDKFALHSKLEYFSTKSELDKSLFINDNNVLVIDTSSTIEYSIRTIQWSFGVHYLIK